MVRLWFAALLSLAVSTTQAQMTLLSGGSGPGRSLIDLGSFASGLHPSINYMKECNGWSANGSGWTPALVDVNNYPNWSNGVWSGNMGCAIRPPANNVYTGDWIITWTGSLGTGNTSGTAGLSLTFDYATSGGIVIDEGSSYVISAVTNEVWLGGSNGAVRFKFPAGTTRVLINAYGAATGGVQITNLSVCRLDQATVLNAGNPDAGCLATGALSTPAQIQAALNPDFVAFERKQRPKKLRFINWDGVDGSSNSLSTTTNRTQQKYDPPVNAITYSANYWAPGLYSSTTTHSSAACSTSSNTDEYVTSAPPDWGGLVDGATVQFVAPASNTTSEPCINVGGTGDVDIVNVSGSQASPSLIGVGAISSGGSYTLVYDALFNQFYFYSIGLTSTVPVAVMASVCNAVATDCWVHLPYLTTIAGAQQLANVLSTNLNPSNLAHIEYCNELWNFGLAFVCSFWANQHSIAINLPNTWTSYYGYRAIRLFNAMKAVWPAGQMSQFAPVLMTGQGATTPFFSNVARFGGYNLTFDASGNYTTGASQVDITGTVTSGVLTATAAVIHNTSTPAKVAQGMIGSVNGTANVQITGPTSICTAAVACGGVSAASNGCGGLPCNTYGLSPVPANGIGTWTFNPGGSGLAVATDYSTVGNRPIDAAYAFGYAPYVEGPNSPPQMTGQNGGVGFYLQNTSFPITNISSASPSVITATGSGAAYSNGDRIQISGSFGISALVNAWTTVSAQSGDTFALSNTTDQYGNSITSNGYTGYTSGGTTKRVIPCLFGGLAKGCTYGALDAADDYASGNPSQVTAALSWYDNDQRNGTLMGQNITASMSGATLSISSNPSSTPISIGSQIFTADNKTLLATVTVSDGSATGNFTVTPGGQSVSSQTLTLATLGASTLTAFMTSSASQSHSLYWWNQNVAIPYGKPTIEYEGGYQQLRMWLAQSGAGGLSNNIMPNTAGQLGISAGYGNEFAALQYGYITNQGQYLQNFQNDFNNQSWAYGVTPAHLQDVQTFQLYSITGHIDNGSGGAGTTLTITVTPSITQPIEVSNFIYCAACAPGTVITASATNGGGNGIYTVSPAQLVTSQAMTIYSADIPATLASWNDWYGDIYSGFPLGNFIGIANFNAGLNFLLKRDLDPASNDNSPVWLNNVA